MIENAIKFNVFNITNNEIIVAIVGYLIVFFSLVLLYFVFNNIPRIINLNIRQRLRREGKELHEDEGLCVTGEVNAAISMAIYLYFNQMHDEESRIITIKKIHKPYSPWNSKIYGLNIMYRR